MTDPSDATGTDEAPGEGSEPEAPLRSLPARLLDAVIAPGRMARTVADNPKWIGALLVCAVLLALSIALLPAGLMEDMQRRVMIQSGRAVPEIPERTRTIIRVVSIGAAGIGFIVMAFIGAAITTFVFAFVLGDEGTYKQYLAVGVHAAFITTLAAILYIPMRVAGGDPQLTINVGTFLPFLPDGYVHNVFRAMDISQVWSSLVAAMGIHAIDRRRSFGSAAAIQLGILFCIALLAGWALSRQGF